MKYHVLLWNCGDGYTYFCSDIFYGIFETKELAEAEKKRLLSTDDFEEDEHAEFEIREVTVNESQDEKFSISDD